MDRTNEFKNLTGDSSRGTGKNAPSASRAESRTGEQADRSSFNTEGAAIGQEIHVLQLKLDELGKLARQKGVFNDASSRIGSITENIAHDISVLTSRVDEFASTTRTNANPQMRQYAESLVQTLRQRLSQIVKGLQEVSELRVRIVQEQEARRNRFSFAPSIASQVASTGGYAPVNREDPELGGSGTSDGNAMSSSMAQYHSSRLSSVQGIQRTIAELGQIFTRMASTLQQQEEMVSRIDTDIDAADVHIKQGTSQLLIYYNSISSNRKLMFKIFAIIILFAIIMAVTS